MSFYLIAPIGIVIITLVSVLLIRLNKNKSNKLSKYIPSFVIAFTIGLVYLKMMFISKGYDSIGDMLIIIFLSIALAVSLLIAIAMDITSRIKRTSTNKKL